MLPLWQRPFIAGDALAFYLAKMLLPWRLGIDYGRSPLFVLDHAWGYLTWLVPVGLGLLLWRLRRRYPMLCLAAALFVAGLLPTLGLVPFLFQTFRPSPTVTCISLCSAPPWRWPGRCHGRGAAPRPPSVPSP